MFGSSRSEQASATAASGLCLFGSGAFGGFLWAEVLGARRSRPDR